MECHVGHGCPGKDAEDGVDVDLPLGWQSFTAVRRRQGHCRSNDGAGQGCPTLPLLKEYLR